MTPGTPDDQLLVGTSEREQAARLLSDAFTQGYLQVDEFDERTRAAYAARTRADLKLTVRELPTATDLFGGHQQLAYAGQVAGSPTGTPAEIIDIEWTTVARDGAWVVPAQLRIQGSMGAAKLDLRRATFHPAGATLDLQVSWSTVKLRVPPTTEIRHGDLDIRGWSAVKDKGAAAARPGGPVIVLTGSATTSDITIRRS